MFVVLAFLALLAFQTFAAAQPVREVTSQAVLLGDQPLPGFYGGYVFFVEQWHRNHFTLYAPDGQLILEKHIQEQIGPSILSIAIDADNSVAVSWAGFDKNGGRCAGIDLLDRNGIQLRSINTGYYLPEHLAFGEDHSLWTFGWERDAHDPERAAKDYMAVRKFSNAGREIAAYLPRSLFPPGLQPACFGWQEAGIRLASDRIGLLACSGMTSAKPEWVEVDLTGNLIGRWRLDGSHQRVAFTRDSRLYVQDQNPKDNLIYLLERSSGTFKPVPATRATLYGSDGDELVFAGWNSGPMIFRWFKQPVN